MSSYKAETMLLDSGSRPHSQIEGSFERHERHERSPSLHRKLMRAIESSPRVSFVNNEDADPKESKRGKTKPPSSPNSTMRQRQPSKYFGTDNGTRGRRSSRVDVKSSSRKMSTDNTKQQKATIILPPKKKRLREAVGQYLLGDSLGSGQFGKVYRGVNSENGEFVAIKQLKANIMDESALTAFESEISLLEKLNHENIVRYYGVVRTTDHVNLVIEYCDGGCLTDIVKKFGNFPEHLCAVYIKQVMRGLTYLHSKGVVHRDIKGANILLTKIGQVKLADFGISTTVNSTNDAGMGMDMGIGSPYWMSPEVIQMEVQPTEKSDIWSLASTVIELTTGHPPYHEYHPMGAIVRCVQDDHPPLPPNISANLEDFLLKCFQKDIDSRASAAELLDHPWLQLKDDAKSITSATELKATIKTLNEGFTSASKISASVESINQSGLGDENHVSNSVRVYGETIRSDSPFKTAFLTSSTICEEVVQLILRKYGFKGDASDYALFEDKGNESRRLKDTDVLMQITKKWEDPTQYKLSIRRKSESLKHLSGTLKMQIKRNILGFEFSSWRVRFIQFDAEDRFMAVFKDERDKRFPEVVVYNLQMVNGVHEVTNDVATSTYEFCVRIRGISYNFRAETYQNLSEWVSIIQGACGFSPLMK